MKNEIGPQINTDAHGFKHGHITEKVIGVFFDVYNELGYGFWNRFIKNRWRWR